jgi:hypothetical protein
MSERLLTDGIQYAGYLLELGLLLVLLRRGWGARLTCLCLYVAALFGVDALVRPWFLSHYGATSPQYYYSYWLTDGVLALGGFVLICALFMRACARDPKAWAFVRPVLALALLFVLALSFFSIHHHPGTERQARFSYFVLVSQNLYFTSAVLNTVLYLLLQHMKESDWQLHLLVCGLGLQYAGPAAISCLVHLSLARSPAAILLFQYLSPMCALGMLVVWLYAAMRRPGSAARRMGETGASIPVTA